MPKQLSGTGVLFTDRRNLYLSPSVTKELWTSVAPFITVASNRNFLTGLQDPLFKQFEHRDNWRVQKFLVNEATPATIPSDNTESTAIVVDGIVGLASSVDASYLGLVVEIWNSTETTKRGVAVITSAPSSTTIKFKSLETSGSIAPADNDVIHVIGHVAGEGASSPEAWADELRTVWGSTQIFRTPVEVTGTLLAAALRGYSKEFERLQMQKMKEHKMLKERDSLFGMSPIGTNLDVDVAETFTDSTGSGAAWRTDASGNKLRTTMGIITAIEKYGKTSGDSQNIFTITEGSYKYANFVDDMEKVFQYYPEDGFKYAFSGPGAISYWSKLDNNVITKSGFKVQVGPETPDPLGFNVRNLETPHGLIKLVLTPALRGPRNKYMLVVSQENLSMVQYRPMEYRTNIKTDNAPDLQKDEIFSDEGVGMTLIESHSLFKIV